MSADASQFLKGLDIADQRVRAAAIKTVDRFAQVVLGDAKDLCPVSATSPTIESPRTGAKIKNPYYTGKSGALRKSGAATPAALVGTRIEATIGFNANYAAAVHERLDALHNYPGAVNPLAQAKYLESPMNQRRPQFLSFVEDEVKSELEGKS